MGVFDSYKLTYAIQTKLPGHYILYGMLCYDMLCCYDMPCYVALCSDKAA